LEVGQTLSVLTPLTVDQLPAASSPASDQERRSGIGEHRRLDGLARADQSLNPLVDIPDIHVHPRNHAPLAKPEGDELAAIPPAHPLYKIRLLAADSTFTTLLFGLAGHCYTA
jgi:hypothetical protein